MLTALLLLCCSVSLRVCVRPCQAANNSDLHLLAALRAEEALRSARDDSDDDANPFADDVHGDGNTRQQEQQRPPSTNAHTSTAATATSPNNPFAAAGDDSAPTSPIVQSSDTSNPFAQRDGSAAAGGGISTAAKANARPLSQSSAGSNPFGDDDDDAEDLAPTTPVRSFVRSFVPAFVRSFVARVRACVRGFSARFRFNHPVQSFVG